MDEFNNDLVKRWHDSRVFNLEKDRFKPKRIISTEITSVDSYSMTNQSLYPYLFADTYNRFYKMCGENVYFTIGIDTDSYASYSFLSNHYLDRDDAYNEYINILNTMGVGFDYDSVINECNSFVLEEIDKCFIKLYNKDIFFQKSDVFTDSLGIRCYNDYETYQENGKVYDIKSNIPLTINSNEYFYFDYKPYIRQLEELVNSLSISEEKKSDILSMLGKRRYVDFIFSNYKENINLRISLDHSWWLGGVVGIIINPQYIDVMPFVCESEQEIVNHYLQNGYQAGVFTGNYVLNPLTGEEVLVFVGYDTECAFYPIVPACREQDIKYVEEFGLNNYPIVENDLMINSDFINGMTKEEASKTLEEGFLSEGMAFVDYRYFKTKIIVSKKEGYGILMPLLLEDEKELVVSDEKHLPFSYNQRMKMTLKKEEELKSQYDISGYEMSEVLVLSFMKYLSGRIDTTLNMNINKPDAKETVYVNEDKIIEELVIPYLIGNALGETSKKEYCFFKVTPTSEHALLVYNTQNINFTRDILRDSSVDAYRLYVLSSNPTDDFEMTKLHISKYEQFIDQLYKLYHEGFIENSYALAEKLYKLSGLLSNFLENKNLDLYIESITKFLYDELLVQKMSEHEALIYLKLVSIVCPFICQKIFEEVFEENYFLVYEEWPFLN